MQAAANAATTAPPKAFSFQHQVPGELQERIEKAQQALETATLAAKNKSRKKTGSTLKNANLTKAPVELKAAQEAAAAVVKKAGV